MPLLNYKLSMRDKINEFEERLSSHKEYSLKRYNQLKNVLPYLQLYFLEGGILADKQTQLNLEMEIESEIEALRTLRYSEHKTEDFILCVNTTLRIVSILKHYIPVEPDLSDKNNILSRMKNLFRRQTNHSVIDLIWAATATWA